MLLTFAQISKLPKAAQAVMVNLEDKLILSRGHCEPVDLITSENHVGEKSDCNVFLLPSSFPNVISFWII
jgi:hypothetical protein